jgi:hypothetical protein
VIRFVRDHAAPGSEIIFDYCLEIGGSATQDPFARWGEPFVFGFSDGGPAKMVREEHPDLASDVRLDELLKRYALRADGTSSLPLPLAATFEADMVGMAIARVPKK